VYGFGRKVFTPSCAASAILPASFGRKERVEDLTQILFRDSDASVNTFFLLNAGIIALAHPVNVERQTL